MKSIPSALACFFAAVFLAAPSDAKPLEDSRPNIVLVMTDDQGMGDLKDPEAEWPNRELFIHCGRWNPGKRDAAKYQKCAVRTEEWRLVNNEQLYHVQIDPSELEDVFAQYPEEVAKMREAYDRWWDSTLPLLVNEGLPRVGPDEQPLALRYAKQLAEKGIPDWAPEGLSDVAK